MAKISAKNSNLKTIANKIIVSPSTATVSDLKFKRRKDFSTFVKWIESSNKALAGIKLPSKKEIEKLGGGSGGGFPWLLALLGVGGLGALGLDKLLKKLKGGTDDEDIDNIQTDLKQDEIRTATNFSGRIPREINLANYDVKKVNPTKGINKTGTGKKIKSSTLKTLNKGTKPKVVNTGTKGGKFTSTPGKAPTIPKKVVPKNKLVQSVTNPTKTIRLDKGLRGVARHGLTVAGRVLAVADAAHTTVDRLQEGQTVKQAVVGGTAEAVGSWVGFGPGFKLGSAVTAKIASPLILAPFPGARPLYGLTVLAGGIAGGFAGSKIGREMAGGLADKFTGVLNKARGKDKNNSVAEKKTDGDNIASGGTIPLILATKNDSDGGMPFSDAMDLGSSSDISSSFAIPPIDDGLNSSLSDLFLSRL